MYFRSGLSLLVVISALFSAAHGHEFTYSALLSGPAEAPPNSSAGVGIATVTLDLDLVTMRVEVTFNNLSSSVTSAHIHGVTATAGTGTAGVATQLPSFPGFPTGVTSGSYDQTFDLTLASSYNPAFITASGGTVSDALNALILGMADGKMYFNLHTSAFPSGEIRGFLVTAIPEPGSIALCAFAGVGALSYWGWQNRRRAITRT